MIAAILRAQFLSLTRFGRASILGGILTAVWYTLWTGAAIVLWFTFRRLSAEALPMAVRLALAAVCAYWQLAPLVTVSTGASLDMRKLLPYPVPRRKLFFVELLLRLVNAVEMILALAGVAAGVYSNPVSGGGHAIPRIAVVTAAYAAFNILLASGTRSLFERWLSKRRVREVLAIVMALVWVLPRFLGSIGYGAESLKKPGALLQFALLPWGAAARLLVGTEAFGSLLPFVAWIAIAWWFGMTQFARNLRFDADAAQATLVAAEPWDGEHWTERLYRWPSRIWRDPLAGIIEKELRSLARNPRFRISFIMGFTFSLLVWFPMLGRHNTPGDSPYFLTAVSMYSLTMVGQASFWNCFGFDRSATAFYFISPAGLDRYLEGKNIATMVFILLEILILSAVTLMLGLVHGWLIPAESVAAVCVVALYMLAAGNFNSVRYPRGVSAERVMQGNSGGRSSGMVFLLYVLTMAPAALAYLARYAFNSDIAFVIILAAAAFGGVLLYRGAMESAVGWAKKNREKLLGELSKGAGPVVMQ